MIVAQINDEMLKRVRTANIAAHSLFQGLDGLDDRSQKLRASDPK
jgi:hypothetical protein